MRRARKPPRTHDPPRPPRRPRTRRTRRDAEQPARARAAWPRTTAAQRDAGRTAWPAARAMPWNAFVGDLWQRALDAGSPLPRAPPGRGAGRCTCGATLVARRPRRQAAGGRRCHGVAGRRSVVAGAGLRRRRRELARVRQRRGSGRVRALGRRVRARDGLRSTRWTWRVPGMRLHASPRGWPERGHDRRGARGLPRVLAAAGAPDRRAATRPGASVSVVGAEGAERAVRAPGSRGAAPLRDELVLALGWARERAMADPAARIGVVVPDLATRREEVRLLAEDLLCPALQWPDAVDAPRPFDLSAPLPLAEVPLVATALQLLALAQGRSTGAQPRRCFVLPTCPVGSEQWAPARRVRARLARGRDGGVHARRRCSPGWSVASRRWRQRWRRARAVDAPAVAGQPAGRGRRRGAPCSKRTAGARAARSSSAEFQARRAWGDALAHFVAPGRDRAAARSRQALANLLRGRCATDRSSRNPRARRCRSSACSKPPACASMRCG